MRHLRHATFVALSCSVLVASATDRRAVEDPRQLLVEALRSPSGRASGIASGRLATLMAARFSTTAPLLIDVSTLRTFRQAGCARLLMKFAQSGVAEKPGSAPADRVVAMQLNYCVDGHPPKSLE